MYSLPYIHIGLIVHEQIYRHTWWPYHFDIRYRSRNSLFGWPNSHWFVNKRSLPDKHKPCCMRSTSQHSFTVVVFESFEPKEGPCTQLYTRLDRTMWLVNNSRPLHMGQGICLCTRDQHTQMCSRFYRFYLFWSMFRSPHIFLITEYSLFRNSYRDTLSHRDLHLWTFKSRFNGQQITYLSQIFRYDFN